MSQEFKPGDKIRCTQGYYPGEYFTVGKVYEFVRYHTVPSGRLQVVVTAYDDGEVPKCGVSAPVKFELVQDAPTSKFKPGDKVRLVPQGKYTSVWDGPMIVQRPFSHGAGVHALHPKSGEGGFNDAELELCPAEKPKVKRDYVADHARRTLRKAGLTALQAKQFVQNVLAYNPEQTAKYGPSAQLSKYSRNLPDTLARCIDDAFRWIDTPQGREYWDNIYEEHNDYA